MPVGLQVIDEDGNVIVDTSTRLGRILGVTTIGASSGTVVDSGFLQGTPFWVAIPLATGDVVFGPAISVSGSTLTYDFEGRTVTSHRLVYGIY